MSDSATTWALIILAGLLLAMILTLLFRQRPLHRAPEHGVLDAFYFLLLGRRSEARKLLAELVRGGQAPAEAYLQLGELLRDDGEAARALALHQGVLARPRLNAELRRLTEHGIGEDLLALNRVSEAELRLASLDTRLVDDGILALHARALHTLGRFEDAAEMLSRRAKTHSPGASDAARYWSEIGREALRDGDHATAVKRARKARALDADQADSYAVEGDVHLAQGKPAEALQIWQEGLPRVTDGRGPLLVRVVESAFQSGQLERVVEELETLRTRHPLDGDLWGAVADLRLRRGDRESFLLLIEDPPPGVRPSLERALSWLRVLLAQNDEAGLERLFQALPDSFRPQEYRCPECSHAEPEPRGACMHCGRVIPNRPNTRLAELEAER